MRGMDLKRYIRDVPDFPAAGVLFRDITPLLGEAGAYRYALDAVAGHVRDVAPEAIAGVESRGFLFGAPVAATLGLPFVPIRKPGKLPAARMSIEYTLEYGSSQLDIHADSLLPRQRVVLVDDLLATGGTALAAAKLIEMTGATVAAAVFLIELASLGGRGTLSAYDVRTTVRYD